jgi:MFS family permease
MTTCLSSFSARRSVLAAVCLAALVLPLSFSGGAVATPAIAREFPGSAAAMGWITNAFMLSFGSLLMAAGTLADRYGRKRTFGIGVGLFVAVSLALPLSVSVAMIDVLRALQGVAAAAALAGGTAALAQEFDGEQRTRAFSLLGTTFGAGLAFGPLVAGLLSQTFGWRAIFLSSALVGGLVLFFGLPSMRETRDSQAAALDVPGTLTFTAMLTLFTFGVMDAPQRGWSNLATLGLFGGAAAMLGGFLVAQRRAARPMLDLSLLRIPRFVGVQLLPIATCYCYVVLLVLLPLRLIGIEGRGAIEAGLLVMPLSLPMLVVPSLAARLARRFSAGSLCAAGLLVATIGLALLQQPAHGMALPLLVIGCGAAVPWGLMDGLSVSVVPKERAGMATGIFNTTRVAGEGIALAIVFALLSALVHSTLQTLPGVPPLNVPEAAQHIAAGALPEAAALLPGVAADALQHAYREAFRDLLRVLTAITLASALAVYVFLGRTLPDLITGESHAASSAGSGHDQ